MVDKNVVRRSYDELGEAYLEDRSEEGLGTQILDEFLDSLSSPARVLDAGCGPGIPNLDRISVASTAFGVDFSRGQLRLAASNVPEAILVQGDMSALPFETSTLDAVVAYWSLIHVPIDEHQTVLNEFARILRPRGELLLCEGTNAWTGENPDWLDSGVKMEWNIAGAETTRQHLQTASFTISRTWGAPSSLATNREDEDENATPWTFFWAQRSI